MAHSGNGSSEKTELSFEAWKALLREDCEMQDKMLAFEALGDSVLGMFWESGLEPSVKALLESSSSEPSKPN